MNDKDRIISDLYRPAGLDPAIIHDQSAAHLVVHHNQVLGVNLVEGLSAATDQIPDGIKVNLSVAAGAVIAQPVHICFGMLPETGTQKIDLNIRVRKGGKVNIYAHCVFPNAVDVRHIMDAEIEIEEDAAYSYLERHIHGEGGGVKVYPKARIELGPRSRFTTEFELLQGRVGEIEIDYETICREDSSMEMTARINGSGDDRIKLREIGHLEGERSRGVLTSRIAVRDRAAAEIYNRLTATAPYARGHVDCKEIIQDQGRASAIPVVEVSDPRAHVTHEAAIGSVDNKQLETLMARGLNEDQAVELIIEGLLA